MLHHQSHIREEEEKERIAKEKKEEEERQAKLDALSAEIKQKCPEDPDYVSVLAKELTTDQRRECYDLVMKFNSLNYKSPLLNKSFIYWSAITMVYGISRMNLFSETRNTGVMIGGPIGYGFVNFENFKGFEIGIYIDNRSDLPVFISKNDVSFYINGRKASDSDITASFDFMQEIDSGKKDLVVFHLKLPDGYQTYEDLLSMNLKVYFNKDSIGKARLFPTAGPLNANDDIRESSNALYTLYWHHAKKYTSNDWLLDVNGIDTFKNAKVYDDRSTIIADMKKAKIW